MSFRTKRSIHFPAVARRLASSGARIGAIAWLSAGIAKADISLPTIISDHMVLKKSPKVPIWGKADPEEKISVTIAGLTASTTSNAEGRWSVTLDLSKTEAGPFEMTLSGKNKLIISDVLVGEVWVASGQSNMALRMPSTKNAAEVVAASANPLIRQFLVSKNSTLEPADKIAGSWISASPETTNNFTAVGYYFAKKLQEELSVPVGIINTSYGGTYVEAWTSQEALNSVPDLKSASERIRHKVSAFEPAVKVYIENFGEWLQKNNREDVPVKDSSLYAGMDISTKAWKAIELPGVIQGDGLPETGAVWVRKIIDLDPVPESLSLRLALDGFDSVYWNGELLRQVTYKDASRIGTLRRGVDYHLASEHLHKGKNVLAIRFFEPQHPAEVLVGSKADALSLSGDWLAKTEYTFPPLSQESAANAPLAPEIPARPQDVPASLYNGMIRPLIPYAVSGVIWYQGEANRSRAQQYRTAFPLMISDWRKQWNQGDFPFYFCQLASFNKKNRNILPSDWAELREAQSATLSLPNTGQAVLIDIGEANDIHPRNKKDVGERLAAIAIANAYGKSIPFSGPVYDSMRVEDGKIILNFKHTDGGLAAAPLPETYDIRSTKNETAPLIRNSPNSQLEGFAICGKDRHWVWAEARIEGDTVIVSSDKVTAPVAVRYAWADNPTCNLINGAGFVASPFRTDDFPTLTSDDKL